MMVTKEDLAQALLKMTEQMTEQQAMNKAEAEKRDAEAERRAAQRAEDDAKLATQRAELDAKLTAQMAKTDARLDKVAKMVGGMGNNQGDVAEAFFYNTIKAKPTLQGIDYDHVEKNTTRSKGQYEDEFDLVLVNGGHVAIIETKYKAHEQDLMRLLQKKYPNFKRLYPEYADYEHHLGLASFHINDELIDQALSEGVMVLQRKGDLIETYVPGSV